MKKFLRDMFNDDNKINEKSFIGFCAFLVMVLFAIADIITGSMGKDLLINDFVFNSFLYLTLGCFGISSVDKFINSKKEEEGE
jgi:fucose 4-O-acetylase-like acetyltransferase